MAAAKKEAAAESTPPPEVVPAFVAKLSVLGTGGLAGLIPATPEQKAALAAVLTPENAAALIGEESGVIITLETVDNPEHWIAVPAPTPEEE